MEKPYMCTNGVGQLPRNVTHFILASISGEKYPGSLSMSQALQLGSPTKVTLNGTSCWHDLARVEGYGDGMKSK